MEKTKVINSPDNTCKWKLLNATTLKLLAVVLMFLDHIHQMFVSVGALYGLLWQDGLCFLFSYLQHPKAFIIHTTKRNTYSAFCSQAGE